jgi:hypothetical protein
VRADGQRTQLVEGGAVVIAELPDEFPSDVDHSAYIAMATKLVTDITEPKIKVLTTIPIAELSGAQRVRMTNNHDTLTADRTRCTVVDLAKAHADWATRVKGNRYDTLKHVLVRAWLSGNGSLTRGDLLWVAVELDVDYWTANRRMIERMAEWISREVSPFRLPQNTEEAIKRAIAWATETVEPAKRKRRMHHRDVLDSTFVNGDALRKFGKIGGEYKLACSISAASIKHGVTPSEEFVLRIIGDVKAYFSSKKDESGSEVI